MVRQIKGDELLFHESAEQNMVHLPMSPSTLDNSCLTTKGLISCLDDVCQEYLQKRNLLPLRILIMGPPMAGKSDLGKSLSEIYDITCIDARAILDAVKTAEEELQKEVQSEMKSKSGRVSDANMAKLCKMLLTRLPTRNKVQCEPLLLISSWAVSADSIGRIFLVVRILR